MSNHPLELISRMTAHDIISFHEIKLEYALYTLNTLKTLRQEPETSNRRRYRFRPAEYMKPEPGTSPYSSSPLVHLDYPKQNIRTQKVEEPRKKSIFF